MLYGRGAVDMKGAIACQDRGGARLSRGAWRQAEGLDLVPHHRRRGRHRGQRHREAAEMGGGARREIRSRILGEPTNPQKLGDMIKIGRRGSQNGTLVVTGTQGHVAYPELADNPVRGIATLMVAINAEPIDDGTAHFGASNLEFTSIDVGNKTVNLIPGGGARALQHPLQRHAHARRAAGADRGARREGRRRTASAGTSNGSRRTRMCFSPPPGPFVEMISNAIKEVTGPHAEALDHRRHLGRALHQGLLPGDRVRSAEPADAQDRRTCGDGRSCGADRDLSADSGKIFRLMQMSSRPSAARADRNHRTHDRTDCGYGSG